MAWSGWFSLEAMDKLLEVKCAGIYVININTFHNKAQCTNLHGNCGVTIEVFILCIFKQISLSGEGHQPWRKLIIRKTSLNTCISQ